MARLEGIFVWIAVGLYAASFVISLAGFVFKRGGQGKEGAHARYVALGFYAFASSVLSHAAAVAARWAATGHPPVMGIYENSLLGSLFVGATFLIIQRLFPSVRQFQILISPALLLILGNGIQSRPELGPLEPPYQSNWLYVHVLFGWLTFGSYLVAAAAAFFMLVKGRLKSRLSAVDDRLLDEMILRLILFGFFSETIMIGSGAIWAHGLWGRYWGWDPVETWSLVSWLTYGLNLHLRLTYGWRGRKAAWLALFSLIGVIALFFGIGFISGVHTQMMG
jgi:cytochrome c-type biogenesis protein CcsB